MDPSFTDLLSKAGTIGVLAFVVIGFLRGWIVPGYLHRRVWRERDELFNLAVRGTEFSDQAIRIAKAAARQSGEDEP